ncbi:hypothetical protein ABKN59_009461 [Abortiporus biennis]
MCIFWWSGDEYTKCGHWSDIYFIGRQDCENWYCRNSQAHVHQPQQNCRCTAYEHRSHRLNNRFHKKCFECGGSPDPYQF